MVMKNMKSKRAAMEMSVGTIVTIVLLMSALVLGLILTKIVYKSSANAISSIDEGVRNQLDQAFQKDDSKKVVISPGRTVSVKKGGEDAGFGFSIRNIGATATFSYTIKYMDSDCSTTANVANKLISLGSTGQGISIPGGNVMDNPILVKFRIPEDFPPCEIRYNLEVKRGASVYDTVQVDIKVVSR
jgi:hypothetical protein